MIVSWWQADGFVSPELLSLVQEMRNDFVGVRCTQMIAKKFGSFSAFLCTSSWLRFRAYKEPLSAYPPEG
jgi:hypothetical protein